MAQPSRTFRIFISSTFNDLKEERNALQTYVFPRLRELCERHQARFQAIDLRWGVSDEAGLDQRTIPICLTEIERCQRPPRPNFIVLLGDRYGWRPLPAQVEAKEFEEILEEVSQADRELLLWGEDQPGDLRGWYRRDDNAVPPEYCLRPREVDVAEDATENEKEAAGERERRQWREAEKRLRSILFGAIDRLGWRETDPRRDKYTLSATEQEIVRGVLQPPDAKDHVFAFFRTIKMRDGRALVEGLPSDGSARDFVDQLELDGRYGLDREAHVLLEDLKERKLRPLLEDHVHHYEAEWTGSGITTDHLSELCKDVWWRLARIMVREFKELGRADPLDREIQSHRMFGRERIEFRSQRIRTDQEGVEFFVGRNDGLRSIRDYIRGREPHLFAVVGVAGSGKSALMAKAGKQTEAEHPAAAVVVRFIGATPGSSDVRTLLSTLCGEIARAYGAEEAVPTDYHELVQEFAKRLALASEGMPLVIFLDGLDQLSDAQHARGLAWLPGALPDHVRVVVSALPGECEQTLTRKYPVPYLVELGAMSDTEGEVLLDLWLEVAGRTLGNRQRRHVRKAFRQSGRLPLYLRLAFEEARLWRSYTDLTKTPLRRGIPRLIRRNLFHRLAMPANHGATLVSHGLGYLAASRFGLSEDEVVDVLSADGDVLQDSQRRAPRSPKVDHLPVVIWSRLYFDLEPYLTERAADGTSLLAFYHRQLAAAARDEYLAGDAEAKQHSALADYFRGRADPKAERSWDGGSERGLSELPYHLAGAARLDDLFETLTDFRFLEHKAAEVGVVEHAGADGKATKTYAGVFALQDDYELALAKSGGGEAAARRALIVTAVDSGDGLKVGCPWCNTRSVCEQEWRGKEIECPNCKGPLIVNPFVVGEKRETRPG